MSFKSRQIELVSRPHGWPDPTNFRIAETEVRDPGDGQIVVRNLIMSVDPYMRGRMNAAKSYVAPYAIDEPLEGDAIGEVVASQAADLSEGDIVLHSAGWREYALIDAGSAEKVSADEAPLGAYLGVLGMPGMTAYLGLYKVAEFRAGDTVWVSGAAGAVGQIAGQLAKIGGAARVVGSAGSAAKVALLTERFGFDAAFDYHEGSLKDQVAEAAPDGLDVYFDNVGGEHLEAAIGAANLHARFALCGASSAYNLTTAPPGPRNMTMILSKRLRLQGFLVYDHEAVRKEFIETVAPLVGGGRLVWDETTFDGLENAPEALLAMLTGKTTGKTLVRLAN
ncbi:NADP-dependent oxidoreductase [Actinomadura madurae]|uniref:NADP-dependent oxidoreductase n=1 Tax=Actinomadura madurae TaxID=1993 RepID=UPI0020271F7C|nr:NADP-dependent oxidoreductase [Actinomadura madurae]MCP9950966.1 NADP-dependent oxidoreductase [Actinomadura madurae]MCP9980201.1 NADP-dependent oxidoreductase [Actinomadura madurae]URM96512.1 NADP-dependent oxidoreductase [Actinomadura madurae]